MQTKLKILQINLKLSKVSIQKSVKVKIKDKINIYKAKIKVKEQVLKILLYIVIANNKQIKITHLLISLPNNNNYNK